MRVVALLLVLATAFGAAALWQSRRVEALEAERELARQFEAGELASGPLGTIPAGWAHVVIGGPAAVDPLSSAPSSAQVGGDTASGATRGASTQVPAPTQIPQAAPASADFEVIVEPGQSLSKIARSHYGTAPVALVRQLSRYNGMADENALRAGQKLRLPPIEQLTR